MKKVPIAMFACVLALSLIVGAAFASTDFSATVNVSASPATITLGESTTFTAVWSANKDVTFYEWSVNGEGQGAVAIPSSERLGSTYTLPYTPATVGTHTVGLRVWHHVQPRNASGSGTVVVTAVTACPAAPAVAGELLDMPGVTYSNTRGYYISAVADQMGPGTDFNGVTKCNTEAYRAAVKAFLIGLGVTFPT